MKTLVIMCIACSALWMGCATPYERIEITSVSPFTTYVFEGICGNPDVGKLIVETAEAVSTNTIRADILLERPRGTNQVESGAVTMTQGGAILKTPSFEGEWELPGWLILDSFQTYKDKKYRDRESYFVLIEKPKTLANNDLQFTK